MQRRDSGRTGRLRRAGALVGAIATTSLGMGALGVGALTAPAHALAAPGLTTLTSEVVHGLAADTDLGAVPATAPMTVGVGMVVDQAARDAAYAAMFTVGSPSYHRFMTPSQFTAAFGVSQAAAARVRAYATRAGLGVVYASPDGSYLELQGTTAQVESTFAVSEHVYRAASGATFSANDVAPTVPSDVAGVSGLTSLGAATVPAHPAAPQQSICRAVVPNTPPGNPAAGMADACIGTLTPQDVRDIYKVPPTNLGAGQKVAIFGEGQLSSVVADLRSYETAFGLPTVPVRQVLVGDDLTDNAGAVEWKLDSQAITGMAPNLQELDFYFGSNLGDPSITATYAAWANDANGPLTGNSSFGGPEPQSYLGAFLENGPLQQAAMEGRTMFVASGDVGGSCLPGANGVTNTAVPCVEYPSSSPYVTGVGGTVLYSQADPATGKQITPATRAVEYAWNFSGGGMSTSQPAPPWQIAAFPGGTSTPCTVGPNAGKTCRGVPDVSAVSGDLVNGYAIYNGRLSASGGTSLSSPLWAGAWANVQAAAVPGTSCPFNTASQVGGVGFAQEDLYHLAVDASSDTSSFFDVGGPDHSIPGYGNGQQVTLSRSALDPTGYDFVTGLGTPILSNATTGGLIGTLNCGHVAATKANTPAPDNTVVTYGVTPPYNNLAADGCGINGQLDSPAGNATVPGPAGNAYDLTHVSLTSDTSSTTFAATVADATTAAANDVNYAFEFAYSGASYAVTVDTGPNPAAALYRLAITATPAGLGVQAVPTAIATLTPKIQGNTISTVLPWAAFNAAATPSTPLGPGSLLASISTFSNVGPAPVALANDFNAVPIDQANFYQCPYVIPGGRPPAAAPEVPMAAALPLAALAVGYGVLRRRRTRVA